MSQRKSLPVLNQGMGPDTARADAGLDFDSIREQLASSRGPDYWRSLEQLSNTPQFQDHLKHEFAKGADLPPEGMERRRFLQVMGASMALAGVSACTRQPLEKIIPYVKQPEDLIPGRPRYFATATLQQGFAKGVLAENHMGCPTKFEGNPDHPASLGRTDHFTQAEVMNLYDPDRSQTVKKLDRIRTWKAFQDELTPMLEAQEAMQGAGIRILTPAQTSPTFAAQVAQLRQRFPQAKWHVWEGAGRENARSAALNVVGQSIDVVYDFKAADVVVALDSDFLTQGPASVRYAQDFMSRRRVRDHEKIGNRLYAFESTPSNTGAFADHRYALRESDLAGFAMALANALPIIGTSTWKKFGQQPWAHIIDVVARDLRTHPGRCIIIAGEQAPFEIHVLALALNALSGSFGRTLYAIDPVEVEPVSYTASMRELVADMNAGNVDALFVLGGNPVYDAPADLDFAAAMRKVTWRCHLSLYEDETSVESHWHLPMSHSLETWSDAKAYDGTATIMQPLIEPLYSTRSLNEVMAMVNGQAETKAHDIVRATWQGREQGDFETWWRRSLHDGVVAGTSHSTRVLEYQQENVVSVCRTLRELEADAERQEGLGLELQFRPDPHVWDGQLANNGWLQELPKPWTRLTWDNAALMSPHTAEELGLHNEEVVELQVRDRKLEAPVWILPGHPDASVTLHLGYGRWRAGRVGTGQGVNAYRLRTLANMTRANRVGISPTGRKTRLASTQDHFSMEGRHLVREGSQSQFESHPEFVHEMGHHFPDMSLYPEHEYKGNSWGMVVDLSACTGCNACVAACNSENNIPVVGKEQVLNAREMHWIRIDRYFNGDLDSPGVVQQPVMCQQCENAPCEVVCPVGATMHSDEGLNEMVYNRCVGTRYCSNNCPYKVRRFNFFPFSDTKTEVLKLMRNPDVSVRTRGVMEKCTYCVQRINKVRIQTKTEGRDIRDGEIVTACQQACPTDALVFGDINDPNSRVSKLRDTELNYTILEDLNTRPHTTFLARITNPHPELAKKGDSHGH